LAFLLTALLWHSKRQVEYREKLYRRRAELGVSQAAVSRPDARASETDLPRRCSRARRTVASLTRRWQIGFMMRVKGGSTGSPNALPNCAQTQIDY